MDMPARQSLGAIWKGTITQPPLNFLARCGVIIPDIHPDLVHENVRWSARDNMSLPQDEDECLVVFDNNQELWIVAWWPTDKRPSIISSPSSAGPPPNPVDGDIWLEERPTSNTSLTVHEYQASTSSWLTSRALSLSDVGPPPPSSDLNQAVYNGWYSIAPGYTNSPVPGAYGALMVTNITYTGACRQVFYQHGAYATYQRFQNGAGSWSAWQWILGYTDTAWVPISLQNSWGNYANGYAPARYRQLSSGLVLVQGLITRPTDPGNGTVIAQLPSGVWPTGNIIFSQPAGGGIARIDVTDSGVFLWYGGLTTGANTGWASLSGIQFYADH